MPWLLAPPIPAKKLNGIEITNAHGHDITRKVNARYSQLLNWLSLVTIRLISGIPKAKNKAQ